MASAVVTSPLCLAAIALATLGAILLLAAIAALELHVSTSGLLIRDAQPTSN